MRSTRSRTYREMAKPKRPTRSRGESSLHRSLKENYLGDGCCMPNAVATVAEAKVDGYRIDVVRDEQLIEIQTRSFSSIRRKLCALIVTHQVRLVHPIALEKWIIYTGKDGEQIRRRKSPRRGTVALIFDELVSFPDLMAHPNLSLEVVLTREEEVQCDDGAGSWRRRGRSIRDRRLLDIVERFVFNTPADFLALLPCELEEPFTSRELARIMKRPVAFARRVTYCLRKMHALEIRGFRGKAMLYARP